MKKKINIIVSKIQELYIKHTKLILYAVSFLLFLGYFSPYLIKGKDIHILVHDNLDQINMLNIFDGSNTTSIFPDENIEEYDMPGVLHEFRYLSISVSSLFYKYLGYFWGYVFNEFLYRLLGFIGLFLLLKKILKKIPQLILILISFSFIALPFWPQGNLSVAGVPLIFLLFYNLYEKKHKKISLILILLFPLYSHFALTGMFIIATLGIIFLYLWIYEKQFNKCFIIGIAVLTISYIVTNYELFIIQFIDKIPNNRQNHQTPTYDLETALIMAKNLFLNSQYHAHSFHKSVILPSVLILTPILLYFKQFEFKKIFIFLFLYVITASMLFGMFYYKGFNDFYKQLHLGVNLARFYFLSAGFWYIMWAIVLYNLYKLIKRKQLAFVIIAGLSLLQLMNNIRYSSYSSMKQKPTFNQIISKNQFAEIIDTLEINKKETRIGCIGFFPSVANYNGLKTIGGYRSFYNLSFKNKFYEIVKDEIKQNPELEKYYSNWGGRAYLWDNSFSPSLPIKHNEIINTKPITTELNTKLLKEKNVNYIFSIAEITNAEDKSLDHVYLSEGRDCFYKFYIYRIK